MTIYLGTQGWSYKGWVGPFYPPGTRADGYLATYAQVFDAVELDTTFYGAPTPARIETWRSQVPEELRFTAKTPRAITHDRRLVDAEAEFDAFLAAMSGLGDRLGAILLQLPPDFTADERPALEKFLAHLPSGFRFAAEFRHRSWLDDSTFSLLERHGVAWTMIDLRYMPITIHVTADFSYVRLLGDHRQVIQMDRTIIDRSQNLERWAEEMESVARRTERVYGFVNNHYSGHSPADVQQLRRLLGFPERDAPADHIDPSVTQGTLL